MENTLNYINTSMHNLQPLPAIGNKQTAACQYYNTHGMTFGKDEVWRFVDFSSFLNDSLDIPESDETHEYEFTCNIPNLDTTRLTLFNGYVSAHDKMIVTEQGVIMGSLKEALKTYPELALVPKKKIVSWQAIQLYLPMVSSYMFRTMCLSKNQSRY